MMNKWEANRTKQLQWEIKILRRALKNCNNTLLLHCPNIGSNFNRWIERAALDLTREEIAATIKASTHDLVVAEPRTEGESNG
jgi:hypothetical protein